MSDDEIPQPPRPQRPGDHDDGDSSSLASVPRDKIAQHEQQIAALRAAVDELKRLITEQRDQGRDFALQLHKLVADDELDPDLRRNRPAPWVVFEPPGRTDPETGASDPLVGIALFVEYYNATYVGLPGSRAVPIPGCWLSHPGLLAEIATLAYFWRVANIGPRANVKDAQYWHQNFRPGFAARLATEWTHAHCRANSHKEAGAAARPDRYAKPSDGTTERQPEQAQPPPAGTNTSSGADTGTYEQRSG